MRSLTTNAILALCLIAGSCKNESITENAPSTGRNQKLKGTTSVASYLKDVNSNVIVGVALNSAKFNNTAYSDLAKQQYNSVSAEYEMKMNSLNPQKYTWVFTGSNALIPDLAKNNGSKRIHGHTLIWYRNLPSFVTDVEDLNPPVAGRADTLLNIMKRHINKTVGYYSNNYKDASGQPLLRSWDVVNEAFYDSGDLRGTKTVVNGVDIGSIWKRYIGEVYIEKAFRYARIAARANGNYKLKLFYNDYGHEYSDAKLLAIYNKVMELKSMTEGGDPIINGVGMQMHVRWNTPIADIKNAISKMASTGLYVHISELDINLRSNNESDATFNALSSTEKATRRNTQESLYYQIAKAYQEIVPVSQRWGITLWNVGDADSWLTTSTVNPEPTLYNTSYTKKNTYYNFRDALNLQLVP